MQKSNNRKSLIINNIQQLKILLLSMNYQTKRKYLILTTNIIVK